MLQRLDDLWRARELLAQLVGKELLVRYKHSALGFLWSLFTPALMTVVFTVVFTELIVIPVEDYAAFFLAGFLVWAFFQNSVQSSVQAITANGPLIRKVYFPREVLPLANVLAQAVHFVLALLAVSPFLVWYRGAGVLTHLPAVVVGVVFVTAFAAGLAMTFAAANVTFRDLQELVVVLFLVWFYATPVIYPYDLVAARAQESVVGRIALEVVNYNPMTWFVQLFRDALYGQVTGSVSTAPTWPQPGLVAGVAIVSLVTFAVGHSLFHRYALSFAKEV